MKRLVFTILTISILISKMYPQDISNKIDKAISKFVAIEEFSGSVLIAKEGKILFAKAYGDANKEFDIPNTINTKFNIGSISKTFTATAIMQYIDAGKLNIDDPVSKYLTDFPFGDTITIFHLLSHTSGIIDYHEHPDFRSKMFGIKNISDIVLLIYDQKLAHHQSGEVFAYSSSGFVLLGAIIEKLSGKTYKEYIQEKILNPLEMKNTAFGSLADVMKLRATGYTKQLNSEFTANIYELVPSIASGGIYTTVEDMLKFDQALYTNKLVSEELKEKIFTPYKEGFALGWRIREAHDNVIVYHGGETTGVSAMFSRYLKDKYTVIVLSNYFRAARPVASVIENILFGEAYEDPKISIFHFLYKCIADKGSDYIAEEFMQLLKDNGQELDNYRILNMLGNALFDEDKVDLAIEALKLNAKLFPDKPGIFWTLGEFYRFNGEKKLAVQSYEKALAVDPEYKNAIESLNELRNK